MSGSRSVSLSSAVSMGAASSAPGEAGPLSSARTAVPDQVMRMRVQIVRHRRIIAVLGTLDVALVLFFVLLGAGGYASLSEWIDEQVRGFTYVSSLFDLLGLAVVRFLLLALYALDFWFFGLFAVPLLFCLASVPYAFVKAIFVNFTTAPWEAQAVIATSLAVALVETLLLVRGMQLHLRKLHRKRQAKRQTKRQSMRTFARADEHTPLLKQQARAVAVPSTGGHSSNLHADDLLFLGSADVQFATPPEGPVDDDDGNVERLALLGDASYAKLDERVRQVQSPMHKLVMRGVYLTWDNNFAEAEAELVQLMTCSPRHMLHHGEINLVKQAITGRLSERDSLLSALDKVDAHVARVLASDQSVLELARIMQNQLMHYETRHREGRSWANEMLGADVLRNYRWDMQIVAADAVLWRALFQLGGGMEVRGAYNLRRAWKAYEGLQREITTAKTRGQLVHASVEMALKFGVGLFYFLVSIVPGQFLTLLEIIGFRANRDLGVQLLHEVQKDGGVRSPMASLVLLMNYLFIPRALSDVKELLGHAEPIVKDCLSVMPNGTMFLLMASHYARKTGEVDDAIPYLTKAIAECQRVQLPPNNYLFELGLCWYMKLDWPAAARIFERLVLDDANQFEMKPMACIQLSSCYIAMGREDDAFRQLARVPALLLNKSNRFAKIAKAKAERIVRRRKAPFLAFDFLYLRRDMAHMGEANLQRSLKLIKDLERTTDDVETRAVYVLLYGANLKFLRRLDEALAVLGEIKQLEKRVVEERYTIPFAFYEIGEILYKQRRVVEAEEAFRYVQNFRGNYDFSDVLRNRIRLCFVQIAKDREGEANASR